MSGRVERPPPIGRDEVKKIAATRPIYVIPEFGITGAASCEMRRVFAAKVIYTPGT